MKTERMTDVAIPVIIILNLIVYCLWHTLPANWVYALMDDHFVTNRPAMMDLRFWTLVTSTFSHREFAHLLISTVGLLSYGQILENLIGTKWFFEFYLVAGLVGAVNHCMLAKILNQPDALIYGSTSALAGVMTLIALIYRGQTIRLFGFIPIRADLGAIGIIGIDVLGMLFHTNLSGSPIGFGAHVGAALVGVVYYRKVLRFRVWRKLRSITKGQALIPVKVTGRVGWVVPCRYDDDFENLVGFFREQLGLSVVAEGEPSLNEQIKRVTRFNLPNGFLEVVEPDFLARELYSHPSLSLTVDNLAHLCSNLESRQVKLVSPIFQVKSNWAVVYVSGPDDRVYQIQGPYPNS